MALSFLAIVTMIPLQAQSSFTVNNLADTDDGTCDALDCTLREAVNAASGGTASIAFAIGGEITLGSTLVVDSPISLNGNDLITVTTGGAFPAFTVSTTATIASIDIDGDFDNDFTPDGQGIVHTAGTLTIDDVLFDLNTATTGSAIHSTSGTVIMTSSGFVDNVSDNGTVYIGGNATLDFDTNGFAFNTINNANRGALTIDTTSTSTIDIFRGNFALNSLNVAVLDGRVKILNSMIRNSFDDGVYSESGDAIDISYTTIAGNLGDGITNAAGDGLVRVKDIISAEHTGQACVGNSISALGINFFKADTGGACTTTGGTVLTTDPKISIGSVGSFTVYTLDADSPAVDRGGAVCTDYSGTQLTLANNLLVDVVGQFRQQNGYCDVGGYELPANAITDQKISQTLTTATLTEGNSVTVSFRLDIFPIEDITITLAEQGGTSQCGIAPTSITLDSDNFDAYQPDATVMLTANNDTLTEGEHSCTIVTTINPTPADKAYSSVDPEDIVITILDDDADLVAQPGANVNFSSLTTAPFLQEGEAPRTVPVTLQQPPVGTVEVMLTPTNGQCLVTPGSLFFDQTTWNEQQEFFVSPVTGDGYEPTAETCILELQLEYDDGTLSAVTTQNVTLQPDPPQQIFADPVVASLIEGNSQTFLIDTLYPIDALSTEEHFITLATSVLQCTISANTMTINATTYADPTQREVTITATADGIQENVNQTCPLQITVNTSTLTPQPDTIGAIVTVLADPVADPPLQVTESTGTVYTTSTGSITLVEDTGFVDLTFQLLQLPTTSLNYSFSIVSTPSEVLGITVEQCEITTTTGGFLAGFTLDDLDPFTLRVRPVIDGFTETGTHRCVINFVQGGIKFMYVVTILDDDDFLIYTTPDTLTDTPEIEEDNSFEITYSITTDPSSPLVIEFDPDDDDACEVRDLNGNGISSITLTSTQKSVTIQAFAPLNTDDAANVTELCQIVASVPNPPANYTAVTAFFGNDGIAPDIFYFVSDPDGQDGSDTVTSTDLTATAAAESATAVPNPTAIPDPVVSVKEDRDQIPARSGPYLGASIVTFAYQFDQTPDDDDGPNQLFYPVRAFNQDENGDVTWFLIDIEDHTAWISDISVDGNFYSYDGDGNIVLDGVFGIGAAGSIFDTINTGEDFGVLGTLTRERNIHRRPSRRAQIIGVIPEESIVSIIGRTVEVPYDDWYLVRDGSGQVGWLEPETRTDDPAVIVDPEQIRQSVPTY